MSRKDIKKNRVNNLLLLHKKYSWVEIAEKSGTNSQYISQVANRVIQKGGKAPRNLSDEYAEMIELGLGLGSGWLDEDHTPSNSKVAESRDGYDDSSTVLDTIKNLKGKATPKSRAVLSKLERLAIQGKLSDKDWILLEGIVNRFEKGP